MINLDYNTIITTDYKILESLSQEEIYDLVTILIEHYRKAGFPYFPIDENKIRKEYVTLLNLDTKKLELEYNFLQQTMTGLNTCNAFHPEMYSVKCKNAKTPMEIFLDDNLFRIALTKRIKYNDRFINDSCVRRTLTAFGGQAVSNFRPSIAKWFYEKYAPKNGSALDPCMGYGGRLMGAICSHIDTYTGIDPNQKTCYGNRTLYFYLKYICMTTKKVNVYNMPFENFTTDNHYDVVFTSPPYFNTEKYSDEETQSYVRYPEYETWKENFLKVLIKNSYSFLKTGGYLGLNVGKPINQDALDIGVEVFGTVPEIYYMRLSKFLGQKDKNKISHKIEPIYIWKKE